MQITVTEPTPPLVPWNRLEMNHIYHAGSGYLIPIIGTILFVRPNSTHLSIAFPHIWASGAYEEAHCDLTIHLKAHKYD